MANMHKIVNPLTNNPTPRRPGPGRNVRLVTPNSRRFSQAAPLSKASGQSSSNGQSQSLMTQVAIYNLGDVRELPGSYTKLPNVPSLSSLRDRTYNADNDVSPKIRAHHGKPLPQTPISPLYEHSSGWRDSAVSALGPLSFSSTGDIRNGHFPYTIKKSGGQHQNDRRNKTHDVHTFASNSARSKASVEPYAKPTHAPKASNSLAEFYRNARGIYRSGPKGEGQQAWVSYKQYRKEKQGHTEVKQHLVKQMHITDLPSKAREIYNAGPKGEGQELWASYKQYKKAKQGQTEVKQKYAEAQAPRRGSALGFSAHQPPRYPPAQMHETPEETFGRPSVGGYSISSRDVPLGIELGSPRFINTNKPLPPVPQLQPAPKSREQVGRALPKSLWATAKEVKVGSTTQTRWDEGLHSTAEKPAQKGETVSNPWWKVLAIKIPKIEVSSLVQGKSDADRQKELKAKISRPFVQSTNEGSTVNAPVKHGGIDRSRMPPLQVNQRLPSKHPSERQEGKQNVNHEALDATPKHLWQKFSPDISVLGRRRKSSDVSFACAGVSDDSWAYVQDSDPSQQYQARVSVSFEYEDLLPEPLFSGVRGGEVGVRNTTFYRPYQEVLDEY